MGLQKASQELRPDHRSHLWTFMQLIPMPGRSFQVYCAQDGAAGPIGTGSCRGLPTRRHQGHTPMTSTATDRAEISRRNGSKSTGPKTPEGKNRSKFNALKHGLSAKTLVLPGEDGEAFQGRLDAWTNDLAPRNDLEHDLVGRAVQVS